MRKKDPAIFTSTGENAAFLRQVEKACRSAANNITQGAQELGTTPVDKAQGRLAEYYHAETFNVDTILQRVRHLAAHVPKSNAFRSPDIKIVDQGKPIQEYSLKYYKDARSSVNAQKGYESQQRLIPGDQREEAQKYLVETWS